MGGGENGSSTCIVPVSCCRGRVEVDREEVKSSTVFYREFRKEVPCQKSGIDESTQRKLPARSDTILGSTECTTSGFH